MLFWVLMILVLIFGVWWGYRDAPGRGGMGMSLLLWVLLFLVGWQIFGFPIQ